MAVAVMVILIGVLAGQSNAAINIALGKPASTNKNIWSDYWPSKAVDGDIETIWSADHHGNPADPTWLKVDLEDVFAVKQIVLKVRTWQTQYAGYYVDYILYSSEDGQAWEEIGQGRLIDFDDPTDTIELNGESIRYLRYDVVGGTHWANLHEIEVYVEPTRLEISGPDEVAEDSQTQYRAIACFETVGEVDVAVDVTGSVGWSVEPNSNCNIAAGLLTTETIDLPEDVTITAEYTEGDNTQEAEKQVSIFAICPSGSALEFDGVDDYVNIADDINLRLPSTLTVEAWVNPIYDGRDYYADAIVVKGQNVGWGPYFNYRIAMENQNLYTWGVTRSGTELFFHGGTPIYDNWQHLAVVADGTKCIAYVNGTEVASREAPGSYLTFEGYPLQIGGHAVTNARWFSGLIDEVRIWNSARTVDEIRANMHRKPDTAELNLVGYWNFDEGEGSIAGDSSGNGNNGTIVGAIWTDSIPPVGDICGLDGLVERNLNDILDRKLGILDELAIVSGKEDALLNYMDDAFGNGELDNLNKGDVVKAKQKIHSAIQAEEQAETAVEKSIEKLDDALEALDIE
jgi:hypothetical protein